MNHLSHVTFVIWLNLIFELTKLSNMNYINQVELIRTKRITVDDKSAKSFDNVIDILKHIFDTQKLDIREEFIILYLDVNLNVVSYFKIAIGSENKCPISIKQLLSGAILTLSSNVIIAHNHPSGRLKASTHDVGLTINISKALQTIDCKLIDSIIVDANFKAVSIMDIAFTNKD